MLEGLEISEVYFKEVKKNKDLRLEAEYHNSSAFNAPFYLGEDILEYAQYNSTYGLNCDGLGYPILRMNEFDSLFIATPKMYFDNLSIEKFEELCLRKNDILMCRTNGNPKLIGKTALITKDYPFIYESHLFKVRVNPELTNASAVTLFLNTKYGRIEIERLSMVGNQANFSIAKFKELRIPKFRNSINTLLEKLVFSSFQKLEKSKQLYKNAETLLLKEIGLQNFEPSKEPVNIKSFADSFGSSGRLDAEYYQPKYDDYIKLIEEYSNGCDSISTVCNLNNINFKPEGKIKYKYIELSNVGKSGDVNGCTIDFGKELPSRARRKVNTGDVIISSIEGSLNSCALVAKEYDKALCSTGFYVINSKLINSETLLVLFKSKLMQNILKQNCSGTILTAINKDEFLNIRIPVVKVSAQLQIADLIEQSFTLKKQSEHLLEVAKRAVEIAIEESESIALEFIKKETM